MITASDLIEEAESWIDTRWKHQGRVKGVGVDCYGLIIEIARKFDLTKFDSKKYGTYGRYPDSSKMWFFLRTYMREVSIKNIRKGTVLFMAFETEPMHLAIYDGENIIHAFVLARKVVKQRLNENFRNMICGAFEFDGVKY